MTAHRVKRRHHAMAARQALRLCEAELLVVAGADGTHEVSGQARPARPHVSTARARAALVAAGLPPHLAAALRRRLHLIPDQEGRS
jgi:hypothetical protein